MEIKINQVKQERVITVVGQLKNNLMRQIAITCFIVFAFQSLWAQDSTLPAAEKSSLDSMFQNDAFINLFNKKPDSSYLGVSIGVSNGIFSLKNNSINAGQATTSKIFYTGSVAYYHKSGLGLTATTFIAPDIDKLKLYQYAISPAYSYYSKKIDWSASYTRYIKGTSAGFDVNPYQNDLYANMNFKKPWLRPSAGIGYSTGRTKEYYDSVITFTQIPRTVTVRDTVVTKLKSFSLNFSVSHIWDYEHFFSRNDELELQPAIMINGSNQRLNIEHAGSLAMRRPIVQQLLKRAYGDGDQTEKFSLQSVALLLSATYGKGKFLIQPQLYLDYYLQHTSSKKLSSLYSCTITYAF